MFAVVRTGGKQYRVAEGDIIAVEKLAGEAGDAVSLDDVLIAGEGEKLQDTAKLTVSAEIVEQTRGEKVTIFKKKRRHNYRRKNGHRQYMTLLRITGIGGGAKKAAPKKTAAKTGDDEAKTAAPKKTATKKAPASKTAASGEKTVAKKASAGKTAAKKAPAKGEAKKKAPAKKAPARKAAPKSDDKDA